jgi:hypothetical protein
MKVIFYTLFIHLSFLTFSQSLNHTIWNDLLKKHVSKEGKVNYKELKKEKEKLEEYYKELKKYSPVNSWSENENKAYWINAYNFFTIKIIIDKYPLKSIKDINIKGKSAWDHKWIELNNEMLSLNDIEHNKLRKIYNDPRIHFLLNCGSFSCPILFNEAINFNNIEKLLEQQTKKFLSDQNRNKITLDNAEISEIFNWYKEDFGSLVKFINKYHNVNIDENTKISFLKYNWSLNE